MVWRNNPPQIPGYIQMTSAHNNCATITLADEHSLQTLHLYFKTIVKKQNVINAYTISWQPPWFEHSGYLFCLRPKHAAHWGTVARFSKEQSLLACVPINYTTKVFPRTITPKSFVVLQVLAEINVLECAKKETCALNRLMLTVDFNYLIKTGTVS